MKEENNQRQLALGTQPVRKLLLHYAVPAIISMTAVSLYNMVDSIFIGRGCGPLAIAGLSVTFPFMNLSAAFGAMVGVGASTVIAVKLGQKDKEGAEHTLGNVVMLNVVIGLAFMILSLIFLDPILRFFGASDDTLPYAREYMQILLCGNVLTHLYLGLNDTVRASGYPRRAMGATLTSVCINVIFDYLFIFVADMGIAGAALGTLCSQAVAFCVVLSHYMRKDTYLRFSREIFRFRSKIVKQILSIGCAPFSINCCACLVVLLINNGLLSHGGDYYVGAYGIANRVIFIFVMVINGLNQGMQPIVGYNYGAGQIHRSQAAYKAAVVVATCVACTCFVLGEFFPHWATQLFTDDDELLSIACHAMGIMTLVFPFVGFQIVSTGFFTSLGMAPKAVFLSMTRQLIFLVPFLLILPRYFGTDGVWYSIPLADAASVIVVAVMIVRQFRIFSSKPNA